MKFSKSIFVYLLQEYNGVHNKPAKCMAHENNPYCDTSKKPKSVSLRCWNFLWFSAPNKDLVTSKMCTEEQKRIKRFHRSPLKPLLTFRSCTLYPSYNFHPNTLRYIDTRALSSKQILRIFFSVEFLRFWSFRSNFVTRRRIERGSISKTGILRNGLSRT